MCCLMHHCVNVFLYGNLLYSLSVQQLHTFVVPFRPIGNMPETIKS